MNLQAAIRKIQRELGITTIFVTHDLGEAMAMSDRMAILLDGRVTAYDKPERAVSSSAVRAERKICRGGSVPRRRIKPRVVGCGGCGQSQTQDESKVGRSIFAIRPEHIRIQKEEKGNSLMGVVQVVCFAVRRWNMQVRWVM
jgi:ABC-type Fe3+/spermidine/putrescine transport system ATPase subunit